MSIYLVTGVNRGIGLELAKAVVADKATEKLYASVRDKSKVTGELAELVKSAGSKLELVEIESTNAESAKKAAQHIEQKSGRLDIVIANAGIAIPGSLAPIRDVDTSTFGKHSDVNVAGVVSLFQATYSLLLKSKNAQFVGISSVLGIVNLDLPASSGSYGTSKAALNWVITAISREEKGKISAYVIHPGLVDTDLGNISQFPEPIRATAISTATSAKGVFGVVASDKPKNSKFFNYDGSELQYSQ